MAAVSLDDLLALKAFAHLRAIAIEDEEREAEGHISGPHLKRPRQGEAIIADAHQADVGLCVRNDRPPTPEAPESHPDRHAVHPYHRECNSKQIRTLNVAFSRGGISEGLELQPACARGNLGLQQRTSLALPDADVQNAGDDDLPRRTNFITAHQKLSTDRATGRRAGSDAGDERRPTGGVRPVMGGRSLGMRPGRRVSSGFVSPVVRDGDNGQSRQAVGLQASAGATVETSGADHEELAEKYKGIEPRMAELILNEVIDRTPGVHWDDVAGLAYAKEAVIEAVVWPMQRPDLFNGLRQPAKGFLLFGPPGTGKTLIGKAIATESGATFFSISASSLMSKWIGEAEKMVRALFTVARGHLPAVIFVDEIDSLLCQRSEGDQDSTRRVKTEFLVQLDGAATNPKDRLLLVGATNRPQELDEAARRRLQKRLYIPLPDAEARRTMLRIWLKGTTVSMSEEELEEVVMRTQGYSGSDMHALCREAAMGPMRDPGCDIQQMTTDSVRPISLKDFEAALCQVRASVAADQLDALVEWDKQYGSFATPSSR